MQGKRRVRDGPAQEVPTAMKDSFSCCRDQEKGLPTSLAGSDHTAFNDPEVSPSRSPRDCSVSKGSVFGTNGEGSALDISCW